MLRRKAYAKVNLALDVVRKRPDGYHDVRMIMQNLDIYDELEFERFECGRECPYGDRIKIVSDRADVPTDGKNLIHRAIRLMMEEYGLDGGISVRLIKNIPVEAGMAGGSTDAAAAFHAVNDLYGLGLSTKELMEQGVKIGADVPYCIMGKTALSCGIGEKLTEIEPLKDCYILVVKPEFSVSTGMVYGNLRVDELRSHPDVSEMAEALSSGDTKKVAALMENVLETVTVRLHPELEEIKSVMKKRGALNAIMSGSGPTVFGLYETREAAKEAAKYISETEMAKEIYVTTPV